MDRTNETPSDDPGALAASANTIGLSSSEADRRLANGQGNQVDQRTARSYWSIIRSNVFTRFNAIITSLAVVVLLFGSPVDALFGVVMVSNSLIGIVQELRAKRSLDALRVLTAPEVGVYRNGALTRLGHDKLVLGDVLHIETGDQIPVDGRVETSHSLEVDESALTGESRPVMKGTGDDVLSGSFVVAGAAVIEADRVGADAWIQQLTREAKDFVLTKSELRVGINWLLGVIGWILLPLSALLLWSQIRSTDTLATAMIGAVAGVVSLVPQGLVLLVSVAMAAAVVRLAGNDVVVQELPAVEGLARIDVLCIDKTGTLTTGRLGVEALEPIDRSGLDLKVGLAALFGLDSAQNSTADAIRSAVDAGDGDVDGSDDAVGGDWNADHVVPFSSARKWSGADFGDNGSWVVGAPEIILDAVDLGAVSPDTDNPGAGNLDTGEVRRRVDELTDQARRVLLVATSTAPLTGEEFPPELMPCGLISLKEEVRPDAADTISYFQDQHVEIRVISGDNARTVSAVASELGIPHSSDYLDLRTVDDMNAVPDDTTVFGRVRPEQKRDLVHLLQEQGHTVAMIGDGVNDIPSLKAADIGIAMDTATPATKSTAQLVLMNGHFDRLPRVVTEGRRVIANMERVSSLFVTKTVYAIILILAVGIARVPFPFLPRHLSLIAAVTIGLPAFALSFRSTDEPCRTGYLRRVLRFAVPAGTVAATATLGVYWAVRSPLADADLDQARTAATITLTLTGLWILYRLVRPVDPWTLTLIVSLLVGFALTLVPSPVSLFYSLPLPPPRTLAVIMVVLTATIALLNAAFTLAAEANGVDSVDGVDSGAVGDGTGDGADRG